MATTNALSGTGPSSIEVPDFGDLFELLCAAPDWHADAACREHPELNWFPERGAAATNMRAVREVCARCLVLEECRS